MLVSVVILTYNSEKFIEPCLRSLEEDGYSQKEIIVIDNDSKDKTREVSEAYIAKSNLNIKYIQNKTNRGCCGGNNDGFMASSGDIVIFLNPDTVVLKGWIDELIKPINEDSRVGITGCKIYYPDQKTLQHCGGMIHPNGLTDHFGNNEIDYGQYDEVREVDYVTGAAFAIRRDLYQALDGLDMDYFPAYFEETDLCVRAGKKGYRILYIPTAKIIHYESVTLTVYSDSFLKIFSNSRVIFMIKNFSIWYLLFKSLPYELKWLTGKWSKGMRKHQLRAYLNLIPLFEKKLFTKKKKNLINN